jgi:membrane associated rhomboid family serine protease
VSGFVPLGIEGGEVRLPVVGLGILVACLVGFAVTSLREPNPGGVDVPSASAALEYWQAHPYLELSAAFRQRLLGRTGAEAMERRRQAFAARHPATPRPSVLEAEQAQLDELTQAALAASRETLFRRLALSSQRGLWQPGWVTHLFLHVGWMHLLGNMVFLAAVALLLEDAWGRGRFLAFYLAGGVVSGAAQYLLDRGTGMVLVGASGAVSACIGAAMVRFASRRMRVGYLLFVRAGTFTMPVWLWGVCWGGDQVLELVTDASPGVAVLAHVAGLGFGAAVAGLMKLSGADRELVATDEADGRLLPSYTREVQEANEALARGDAQRARELYELARASDSNDVDALWGLASLDLREQRKPQALAHLERLLAQLGRTGQREQAKDAARFIVEATQPGEVRPALALAVVKHLGLDLARPTARRWWGRAAEGTGAPGAMAAVHAATLALDAGDLDEAQALLGRLDPTALSPELQGNLAAARRRLPASGGAGAAGASSPSPAPQPVLAARRQVLPAALLTARTDGLAVQLRSGPQRVLQLTAVKAVAAGYLATGPLQRRATVLVLLDWGGPDRPAVLLQIDEASGGVERLRPQAEPAQACFEFAVWLAQKAGVPALPSLERLRRAEGPFCADAAALCAATFEPSRRAADGSRNTNS